MKKISLLSALILSVSIAQAQIGINTTDPQAALHVEGDLIVTETPLAADNDTSVHLLCINPEGLVVKRPKEKLSTSDYFSIISNSPILSLSFYDTELHDFNNYKLITFKVMNSDITANTLGMRLKDGFVEVSQTGVYQISSLINFRFVTDEVGTQLYINIVLQKSSDGGRTWSDQQGFRPVYTMHKGGGIFIPVAFPTIISNFTQGDLLRFSFTRTKSYTGQERGISLARLDILEYFSVPSFQFFMTKL